VPGNASSRSIHRQMTSTT